MTTPGGFNPLTERRRQQAERYLRAGASVNFVAKKMSMDWRTADKIRLAMAEAGEQVKGAPEHNKAIPYEELNERAKAAWDDFPTFFKTYIAPKEPEFLRYHEDGELPPISKELADLAQQDQTQWTLVNIHPGIGKTTLMLAFIVWRIVRDRNIKGFYITMAQSVAKGRLRWIKGHLERNEQLIKDFGRFKPVAADEEQTLWTSTELTVLGATAQSKEPTLAVYGAGQGIYGVRVQLIVADDVIDIKRSGAKMDPEELSAWWDANVQSRLEPNGIGFVIGTRLGPNDLYGHLGNILDSDGDHVFRWIKYLAHDLTKCQGTHSMYPEGCLLDPTRWPLKKLNGGVHAGRTWSLVYQQEDVPSDEVLIERAWIFGGTDSRNITVKGCTDLERSMWQLPKDVHGAVSVVTLDPSPTKYWSLTWRLVEFSPDGVTEEPVWHIMAHTRKKMSSSDLLDFEGTKAVGVLEQWRLKAQQLGHPIKVVIPEANAAQRWLLQNFMAKNWARQWGIKVLPHQTQLNKTDPDLGIWLLRPRYYEGRVRIPYADPQTRAEMNAWIYEHTNYPFLGRQGTDDTVMDDWFLLYNERKLRPSVSLGFYTPANMPVYLQERRGYVNPSTGARTPFQVTNG